MVIILSCNLPTLALLVGRTTEILVLVPAGTSAGTSSEFATIGATLTTDNGSFLLNIIWQVDFTRDRHLQPISIVKLATSASKISTWH